jgi:UDP-N-acetylglucosamine 4,6-dehydratase
MNRTLIFGGAGSLGNALVSEYLPQGQTIVVASRDEAKHWELRNKFSHSHASFSCNLTTEICDVRDYERVLQVVIKTRPDTIIVAQAMKQVDTCEANPDECIKTNINGVQNIIKAVETFNSINSTAVSTVCFVSTDKACNPVNVYGMSKSISERLILNASVYSKTRYVITRYGNVLSSKGSIIPLFVNQSKDKSCIALTVTDARMTRFLMTLDESVSLINNAITHGISGTIWVPLIPSMLILDLAQYFSDKCNKPIKITGIRLGEKIHESMVSSEEMGRSVNEHGCLVVQRTTGVSSMNTEYSSDNYLMSKEELYSYMDSFIQQII